MANDTVRLRPTRVARYHATEIVAIWGFLLLFPGFFAYQALIAATPVPPLLGGGAGVAAVVTLLAFAVTALRNRQRMLQLRGALELLVAVFLVFMVVWATTNAIVDPRPATHSVWLQTLQTVAYVVALVLVGRFLPLGRPRFARLVSVMFGLIVTYTVAVALVHGEVFVYDTPLFAPGDGVASYQGTARSVFVVALMALALVRSSPARMIATVAGIVTLFLIGARSEFVAFVFGAGLLWAVWLTRGARPWLTVVVAGVALTVTVASFDWSATLESRQAQLLDLESASSWTARSQLLEQALVVIRAAPVFGRVDAHVTEAGSTGAYVHNALSAWTTYGVVGFLLYIVIVAAATAKASAAFLKGAPPLERCVRLHRDDGSARPDRQVGVLDRSWSRVGPLHEPRDPFAPQRKRSATTPRQRTDLTLGALDDRVVRGAVACNQPTSGRCLAHWAGQRVAQQPLLDAPHG